MKAYLGGFLARTEQVDTPDFFYYILLDLMYMRSLSGPPIGQQAEEDVLLAIKIMDRSFHCFVTTKCTHRNRPVITVQAIYQLIDCFLNRIKGPFMFVAIFEVVPLGLPVFFVVSHPVGL